MKNWKETLVKPATLVRKAIETIDKSSMQIALVVDTDNRLMGTVTDGDVRRGILKGISLDNTVDKVMETKPIIVSSTASRENILAVMKQKQIHQIPIVDTKGRVVGLEVLDQLLETGARDNWVVVMAGGLGSRLRPLTDNRPKPLIHVGAKPILETIIENLVEYGFHKFYLSVNYKNEMVKEYFGKGFKWNIKIRYLKENRRLGTAGSLSLLPKKPKRPVLVMNGDLLTKINFAQLMNFHDQNKAAATMCVKEYDLQVPYGVVRMEHQYIRAIDEKPVHRFFVNAGIYVLEPQVLKYIPKKKAIDMTHLFEKAIQDGLKPAAFPIREYWLDVGRVDDLERANGEFASVFKRGKKKVRAL